MPLTRRQFIWSSAASAVLWRHAGRAERLVAGGQDAGPSNPFQHGVASGDPLHDRVILWTRVTPAAVTPAAPPVEVRWRIARDASLGEAVGEGTVRTDAGRDFTVKVDATGLEPGGTYFYAFETAGEQSPVGRTRTLPAETDRVRLASLCCSNYPAGFFNVYRCVAGRGDLDAVVHLGDYIYEFENGIYGDGSTLLRVPEPPHETVTLDDYRIRYATYRTDPDLQAAHRQHPFIAVWDDHELTNDAWARGAANHNPDAGEGEWAVRRAAAYQAYLEWMPIREPSGADIRLYRSFRFGSLVDLVMLDTRGLRDRQASQTDVAALAAAERSLLGPAQEQWFFERLRESQDQDTAWRLVGQQIMFSRTVPPGRPVLRPDAWDGYQGARARVLDFVASERIRDLVVLSGDVHSSWAFDVPRDPWTGYDASTGNGSLAVELLAPAISSPPLFDDPELRERGPLLRAFLPHLKYLDGEHRGYVLLDVTRERLQADWYHVPTVLERSPEQTGAARFICERGSSRLVEG